MWWTPTPTSAVTRWRRTPPRILASNTKLFTTAAVLAQLRRRATLATEVLGDGALGEDGVCDRRPLPARRRRPHVRQPHVRRSYGGGGRRSRISPTRLDEAGVSAVTGRVFGDESHVRRAAAAGPPATARRSGRPALRRSSSTAASRTLGSAFQTEPGGLRRCPARRRARRRASPVRGAPRAGGTPGRRRRGRQRSARRDGDARAADQQALRQLLRRDAAQGPRRRRRPGAADTTRRARGRPPSFADSSAPTAAGRRLGPLAREPRRATGGRRLLDGMLERADFGAFNASLPIAGRDGTLGAADALGPARGRCRGKTGTLRDVSALSGYCRSGRATLSSSRS